jgi:hypothetical protein
MLATHDVWCHIRSLHPDEGDGGKRQVGVHGVHCRSMAGHGSLLHSRGTYADPARGRRIKRAVSQGLTVSSSGLFE